MYKNDKSLQGCGRGRGQRGFGRGSYRPAPYIRPTNEVAELLPRPTSDDQLPGFTATERAMARARDDIRVAKAWQTHFNQVFEKEEYMLPTPRNSHQVPRAESLKLSLDEVLKDTVSRCKTKIDEHLQGLIREAEDEISNPQCQRNSKSLI